jgi:hypothetical protein
MQPYNLTQSYQSQLAGYCRTGQWNHIPGVHTGHVQHYRRLVYNVIDDMLRNAFPVMSELVTKQEWDEAVQVFFSSHSCHSPQVWYMPKEFYQFVLNSQHALLQQYPCLAALMQYEWMEVELFMMEDITVPHTTLGDVVFSKLVINPEHTLMALPYPVHQKKATAITNADKGNYFIAGYRNTNGDVLFTDLSPALVRMIEYLSVTPLSVKQLIGQLESEFQLILTETDKQAVIQFFETAYLQQLIIGFADN